MVSKFKTGIMGMEGEIICYSKKAIRCDDRPC